MPRHLLLSQGSPPPRRLAWATAWSVLLLLLAHVVAAAATFTYLNGNLYNHAASGVWANHREHSVAQHGGLTDRYVQTGHQNSSGAHVAIVRGWGNAAWGPSGPNGYYGQPKCWRLLGPSPVGATCKRVTA